MCNERSNKKYMKRHEFHHHIDRNAYMTFNSDHDLDHRDVNMVYATTACVKRSVRQAQDDSGTCHCTVSGKYICVYDEVS